MRPQPKMKGEHGVNAPGADDGDAPGETPIDFQPESGAVPHDPPSDEQLDRDPRDDI